MLAMISVGAWSAQRGGRALFAVPASFVFAMALGWASALSARWLPLGSWLGGGEALIAWSVLALGLAIALKPNVALALAVAATLSFGWAHGYSHGLETPPLAAKAVYLGGFLLTTVALHVAGAVSATLALERANGARELRCAGALVAAIGGWLILTSAVVDLKPVEGELRGGSVVPTCVSVLRQRSVRAGDRRDLLVRRHGRSCRLS
jgi:urease accessory protein